MIKLEQLNPHKFPITPEIESNLKTLLTRLNALGNVYGKAMIVSSGLRSEQLQKVLISTGRSTATHSKHLTGEAADIYDPDGIFWQWLMDNINLVEQTQLWLEDKKYCPMWVHCQIVPPLSGKRIFIP